MHEGGCLLWRQHVIILDHEVKIILEELHNMHPGICRMMALAWGYVWWPGKIKTSKPAFKVAQYARYIAKSPQQLHYISQKLWSCIHLDYARHYERRMFLIILDAYSKWLDVHPMNTTTATIGKLCCIFAEHGLLDQCMMDNATYFTGAAFKEFMTNKRIKHITSSPYHLVTNGQAERAVQSNKHM